MAYTEILTDRAGLRNQLDPATQQAMRQGAVDATSQFGRGWASAGLQEEVGFLADRANNAYRNGDTTLAKALELQMQDKAVQAQQWAPTVQNFTDINSVGTAMDWATGSLGQGLRSTLLPAAGSLVGAGAGALTGIVTKNPSLGAKVGAGVGGFLGGYNMEANETIASAMMDPTIREKASMQEIKDTGRAKGAVAGALEAVVPAMMVGKAAGLAGRVGKGQRLANIGKSAGQGAITEFGTETAQDVTGQVAENSLQREALSNIDPVQAFNAGMAGAVAGGGMGAMGGAAQVATSALGAGVDRAKDVAGNPVGEAVGRLSAKKTEREILKATGEDERIMEDPNSTPEQRREAALRYAAQLDKDPTATAEEKEIARKYANSPEVFADSLYIHRREKEQNDAHDAIINELNGGKKKSLMRGTLTDDFGEQEGRDSLDDIVTDDQGKVVLGEHGHPMKREVKDGYGGATMITAQPGATQPVPGNEVSAPNTTLAKKTRAEEVASAKQAVSAYNTIDKAAAAQIGTFHQPEQDGVKSQNTERLADAAEIWRKQGISDKLISATSGVTDAKQREMSMAMLRYVSKGLKGDDGNVFVPESLVEVYGEKAGTMINSAAQVAVVKGLADPSILNDAKHAQKIADDMHKQNKDVFSAVRDNMLDAAKKIYSDKDVAKFVPEMRRMAQEGTTKSEEAFLMRLYGSKEAIAAAMSKFKEKTKTPKQAEATARADDGYDGDEDLDYEDKLASANKGSHDSGYAFRGRGKDPKHENYNAPFDLQNDYHIKELSEALGGTDAFTKENGVYGVVSAVREQFEGEELHDAENALIDKHGYDFLSDSQKSAMEEYGDGLPVSDLVNELPAQARKSILDKINKRFVMYSPAQTDSAAPADKVYSISALENKNVDPRVAPWVEEVKGKDGKTFKIHHIGGTVDSGVLYLEKVGVKTPFKTTVMDILRHTNKANAVENPHGVSKGVGAHESMQALFQGLSALFETGKFTGRIGYKTEITEADKKEPFASVKWVEDFDKLPGELKLGARTLADARKAESEALASGDGKASHKYQPEFAVNTKGKRSALEKVFDTIEAEIEAFVKEAVEQIETKTIARFKAYAKKKGWSDSWVKGQKGREILDGWIKNDTAKVEAESRKKAQDRIAFRLDEMVGGNIFVVETVDDNGDLKRIPQNPIDVLNSVLYSPSTKKLNKVYTALRNSWRSTADALVGGGSTIGTTPISQRREQARPLIEAAKFAAAHEPGQMPKDTTVDPNNVTGDHKRNRKTPRTDAEQWISEDKEQMTASEGDATRDVQEHAGSIRDADPTTEFYRTERGWIKGDDTNPGMVEGNSRGGDRLPTGTAARSANDSTSQAMHPKDDERQMAAKVKLGAAQLADEAAVTHLRQGVPHAVKVGADMRNATDKKSKSALVAYTQALNRIAHSTAKQISKDFAHLLTNSGKEMTEGVARSIIQRAKTTLEGLGGKEIEGVVGLTKGDGRSAAQRDTEGQAGDAVADSQRGDAATKLGNAEPVRGAAEEEKVVPMNYTDGVTRDGVVHNMRPEFKGKSTLDLIKDGARTASTRNSKPDLKVGDKVTFTGRNGEKVNATVTKGPYRLQWFGDGRDAANAEKWSKLEGWSPELFRHYAKKGSWQFQYAITPVQSGKVKLPGDSKYTPKDQAKSDKANKFIGRGSAKSDTARYAAAWGNLANTGTYSSSDTVFISAEGNRSGRVDPDFKEIKKAIDAGVTLITDDQQNRDRLYNVGERQVAEFLQNNGYAEVGPGVWKPVNNGAQALFSDDRRGVATNATIASAKKRAEKAAMERAAEEWKAMSRSEKRETLKKQGASDAVIEDILGPDNRLIEGFEHNKDSNRSEVSTLIDELKSLLDDTEIGPFGRHRFVYNKDHQSPKELAEFIEHLAAIERGLNGATPKQEKAVSEMLTKVYRAFEQWSGQHVVDAVEGGNTNTPPKGAIDLATTNPDTPVWGVVTPKDEDGVGELLAAFKDIGRASTYAEQVGGNLVNDLLKNLVGKSKNRDGNTSDTDSAQKIIQETDENTVVFDGKTYSTNNQKEMDALDAAITEYVKRGHKEAMEVFSNVNDVYPYEGAFKDAGYKIDDNGDLVEADTGEKIYKPSVYNPNQQTMFSKQNADASKGATKEETDAVREQILKTVGPDTDVMFHESFTDGSSGVFTPDEQRDLIEISLHSDVAGTGFHEAMHKFFKILRKHGGPAAQNLLERVAQRGVVMKQLEVLLHDHPKAWAQAKSDPEEAAAFMYQFWKKGLLNIGPETKTVFQKIAKLFNRVFRRLSAEVRDEIAAEKMMRAFSSGQFADPAVREAAVAALQKRTEQHDAALKAIGEGYRKFATGVGRLAYTSQGVLESSNNKYFKEIGNWFNQQAGTVLQKFGNNNAGSYFDAVHSIHNYFNNRFENIVEGLSKPELEIVRKALANGTDSHIDRIQRVIEQMRSFNDEMGRYMEARNIERLTSSGWEKVRMRKDFGMPQVWDREKVAENKADVVKLLMEHHFDELAKIASQAEVEIAGGGKQGDAAKRAVKENSAVTPQMVAEAIVDNMAQSGQIEMTETGSDLGITPFAASVNKRSLDWISNKVFDDYKSKDLFNAYTTYIAGMVKRGEYTVRFGRDGDRIRDNVERGYADMLGGVDLHKAAERNYNEAMETWREAVKQDGKDRLPEPSMMKIIESTYKEINGDTDEVKAKIKSVNKSIAQYQKAIMGLEGTLGADISEAHRTINSALVTYQSVRLLSASLFTSLNDVIGIVAAGGTLSDAWEGFVTGIKEAKMLAWNNKKSTNELAKNAEMWGTVEGMAYNDTLGQMYASQYMTGRFKTISDTFFRRIGMEGWNRGMRMVASKVGDRIITDWANGKINMKDPAEAARFKHLFGEGVSPSDIKLKDDGTLDKSDFLNRAAMARFVNDAVLRPNAAHRTIWGNDTRFAPLWSMKSYTYSFHKVIIESAIKQAGLGNYRPVMALVAGYAPIAIAAGAIKEMLMPGDEPPWMKSGLGGYLSYGFDRANLLGIPQMYAGSLIPGSRFDPANVFGPTVDQIQGFASIPFLQDKTLLGESAGAMPFGNVARRIVGE